MPDLTPLTELFSRPHPSICKMNDSQLRHGSLRMGLVVIALSCCAKAEKQKQFVLQLAELSNFDRADLV